ncbi:hypothetical protein DOTSEDRAFT_164593 [Dothistroma septosporum NZE10]|uniref:SnoaL-like domain-containing protein n=1 Tax=Dothistroma septosporum (strain NZE10 / CBS 128990) TaxID=675120 RepID=N1Q254_DOTSN|nr:hypothetical protein DOTSEDRAFT_164593 [Dothistroma septosporum NZE10]
MADSDLYNTLETTAMRFITSLSPATRSGNEPNRTGILSNLATNFQSDFGHKVFVSSKPHLQGQKSGQDFVNRMSFMAPKLETWRIDITDVMVDSRRQRAMVRGDFHMTVKGGQTVVNDLVFLVGMDEEGRKVVKVTEFVDAEAAGEIARLMRGVQ